MRNVAVVDQLDQRVLRLAVILDGWSGNRRGTGRQIRQIQALKIVLHVDRRPLMRRIAHINQHSLVRFRRNRVNALHSPRGRHVHPDHFGVARKVQIGVTHVEREAEDALIGIGRCRRLGRSHRSLVILFGGGLRGAWEKVVFGLAVNGRGHPLGGGGSRLLLGAMARVLEWSC